MLPALRAQCPAQSNDVVAVLGTYTDSGGGHALNPSAQFGYDYTGSPTPTLDPAAYPGTSAQWPFLTVQFAIGRSQSGTNYAVAGCGVLWTIWVEVVDSHAPGGGRMYKWQAKVPGDQPLALASSEFSSGGDFLIEAQVNGTCAAGGQPPQGQLQFNALAKNQSVASTVDSAETSLQYPNPPWFLLNLINFENGGTQITAAGKFSESPSGDIGVMQINESTSGHAEVFKSSPDAYWNFNDNIGAGLEILIGEDQHEAYHDWDTQVIAACHLAHGVAVAGPTTGTESCTVGVKEPNDPDEDPTLNPGGYCSSAASWSTASPGGHWQDLQWVKHYNVGYYLGFDNMTGRWFKRTYKDRTGGMLGLDSYVQRVCNTPPLGGQ